jgi:hypothetical protein
MIQLKQGEHPLQALAKKRKIRYSLIADENNIDRYRFKAWMFGRDGYKLSDEELKRISNWLNDYQTDIIWTNHRMGFYNR